MPLRLCCAQKTLTSKPISSLQERLAYHWISGIAFYLWFTQANKSGFLHNKRRQCHLRVCCAQKTLTSKPISSLQKKNGPPLNSGIAVYLWFSQANKSGPLAQQKKTMPLRVCCAQKTLTSKPISSLQEKWPTTESLKYRFTHDLHRLWSLQMCSVRRSKTHTYTYIYTYIYIYIYVRNHAKPYKSMRPHADTHT
jgi:hypothetical protein